MNQNGDTAQESPVSLQRNQQEVLLTFPPPPSEETIDDWGELWQNLKHRLNGSERFWESGAFVCIQARDRLFDSSKLSAIAQALAEVGLTLHCVETTRRQTAVAAATAGYSVRQPSPTTPLTRSSPTQQFKQQEPLYLKNTIRSGTEVRHEGTIILVGDVNPGGAVMAYGDIIIWGRLRGLAHAGLKGDRACRILSLQLQATQLRIADVVARTPSTHPAQLQPEIAYIAADGIRITQGLDFLKTYHFVSEKQFWQERSF